MAEVAAAKAPVRPGFINVGPGRSGTSWLMEMLGAHPEIAMARVKETEFFNTHHARGTDWYLAHFETPGRAVGEISNMYYVDEDVAGRIHAFDPDMRIIFNVRDPGDLLASMIAYGVRRGMAADDPAILATPIGQVMGSGYNQRRGAGTLTRGDEVPLAEAVMLSRYIAPFRALFPPEQIYFLVYDRIATEPRALLEEIYGFLGVDPAFVPQGADEVVNPAITPRIRWLGALIPRVTFLLRRIGAYGLLGRLHRSRLIKRLLYRTPPARPGAALAPEIAGRVADERARLIDETPGLARFWASDAGGPGKPREGRP